MSETTPEQWRTVAEWSDYEVSDLGHVRSWKRYHKTAPVPRVMRMQRFKGKDYFYVMLSDHGRTIHARIATLVAEAFIGQRPDGTEIRHLDGDAANNRASNLEYAVHSVNMRDRRTHGTDVNINKTHCPHGHAYTAANTRWHGPNGTWRHCRTCEREQRRNKRRAAA